MDRVFIKTEFIKLDAFLKYCGAAPTGGHAKEMVLSGMVTLDGQICIIRGKKLYPGSIVSVDGKEFEVTAV